MSNQKILFFFSDIMQDILTRLMNNRNLTYEIGNGIGKVWRPADVEPEAITALDCSGFTKYLIYRTTLPHQDCPAGSLYQQKWCENNNFLYVDYATKSPLHDNMVRIAFREKHTLPNVDVRHVWLVINGWTVECTSRGSNNGPTAFPWDERRDQADHCFTLGPLFPPRFDIRWIPAVEERLAAMP